MDSKSRILNSKIVKVEQAQLAVGDAGRMGQEYLAQIHPRMTEGDHMSDVIMSVMFQIAPKLPNGGVLQWGYP